MPEIQTLARLDHFERDVLNRALVHIRIAYPEWPDASSEASGDETIFKALKAAATKNNLVTAHQAMVGLSGLDALAHTCAEQADLPYWRDQLKLDREEHRGIQAVSGTGGIPLIGNPEDFCRMLAETREWQLEEVDAAREILRAVLVALGAGEAVA